MCCVSVGRAVASDSGGRGSNPVIGKIHIEHLFTVNENIEKEARNGPFFKKTAACFLKLVFCFTFRSPKYVYRTAYVGTYLCAYQL